MGFPSIFVPPVEYSVRTSVFPSLQSLIFTAYAMRTASTQGRGRSSLKSRFQSYMRRVFLYVIMIALILPGCSNRAGGRTTMVVKPKNHHWWFNKKKDKGKKRTKMVKMRN
jgi:hypothetical protein